VLAPGAELTHFAHRRPTKPASFFLVVFSLWACSGEGSPHCDATITQWCATAATASCDWSSATNAASLCAATAPTSLGQCGAVVALRQVGTDVTTISYFDGTSGHLVAVTSTSAANGSTPECLAGTQGSFTSPACSWSRAGCPDGGP
jgi:hypothetical protein